MRHSADAAAATIARDVLPFLGERDLSLCLVGGSTATGKSIRESLATALTRKRPRGWRAVRVYYPEDLLEEILWAPQAEDLLTLENALATSVHATVILVESAGSICELGAFANHESLRERLVVVVDRKHKRQRSFIMQGPVRYLKQRTRSSVLEWDWSSPDLEVLADRVLKEVRHLASENRPKRSLENPILAELFLLSFVFIAQPATRSQIGAAVAAALGDQGKPGQRLATSAIAALTKRKELARGGSGYSVTPLGIGRLQAAIRSTQRAPRVTAALDGLRVAHLNYSLRGARQAVA